MGNVIIAHENFLMPTVSYTPTVTFPVGSGWIDTDKLRGDVLSEMARCPSVLLAKTQMVWDMGTDRAVRVYSAPFHNCTLGDKVRARLATDAAITNVVYDTGWQDVIGEWFPFGSVPYGDAHWWGGMPTLEDLDGYCPPWIHVAAADSVGRYVKWEFDVTSNPAGYLDVGRLSCGPAIQPAYNFSYGVKLGWADRSRVERSRGGAVFGDRTEKYRTASFQLDWLSQSEAYGQYLELQRRAGVTKPFMFIYDPEDDAGMIAKRSFMARLTELRELSHRQHGVFGAQVSLEEYK